MHKDSINVRWKTDELSPAENIRPGLQRLGTARRFHGVEALQGGSNCADFDKSYYDQLGPLASLISGHMGNGDARDGVDSDGDGEIDECDDRDGVETWFGLCTGTCRDVGRPTTPFSHP